MAVRPFDVLVNSIKIPEPAKCKIEREPISDGERLIDGTLVVKGIAPKYKITLTYPNISEDDLMIVLGQTWDKFEADKTMTQTVTFPYLFRSTKTIRTYFAPLSVEVTPDSYANGYWENFELVLTEI